MDINLTLPCLYEEVLLATPQQGARAIILAEETYASMLDCI
jgi:hypothetical protein